MLKTNYINHQEILKDGSYCKINSYGKRKRLLKSNGSTIKKTFKTIVMVIWALLYAINPPFLLILIITFVNGCLMLFVNAETGVRIVLSSLIVGLIVEPIVVAAWCKIPDYI